MRVAKLFFNMYGTWGMICTPICTQVRDREPSLGRGAKVVAVSLDKVSIQIFLNPNVKSLSCNIQSMCVYGVRFFKMKDFHGSGRFTSLAQKALHFVSYQILVKLETHLRYLTMFWSEIVSWIFLGT